MFYIRHFPLLVLLALAALLPGCFERKQTATLNPDGSGKMFLETIVAVPSQGLPGKDKPTALSFGRIVAADLINTTRGVDAWADVAVSELEGGRARITATAYFKDLNALRFDMPLIFVWRRDATGVRSRCRRLALRSRCSRFAMPWPEPADPARRYSHRAGAGSC